MAVHQQQNPGVVITGAVKTTDPEILIVAVVGDKEAPHTAEDVGQVAVAVFLDFILINDGHRGWSFHQLLLIF